ncbi:sigma-E processing peptidase SpoIIGA [Paenibacillus gansuensis]|uniref:Sporulation sigma-E factor-processing peptidase n=1 Tax=Paenibacillus gansuensis TaxID=306542 RepID=A0ABW5PEC8_9BACL
MSFVVVYADLIFLFNLLIDALLLLLTAKTRHLKPKLWRLLLSSTVGASYVIFMLIPSLSFLFTFLIKFMLSLVMMLIAFGYGSLGRFAKNTGAFYCINFAAAGGIVGAYYLFQNSNEVWNGILVSQTGFSFRLQVGFFFVVIFLMLSALLYRIVFAAKKKQDTEAEHMAEVSVLIDSHESVCTGLIDTGNHLYDPLTRTPVMIMEAEAWKEHLPEAWMKRIRDSEIDEIISAIGQEDFPWQDRLRLVPYRGLNRGTQFMLAIKPDKVTICLSGKVIEATKVLIGLDGGKLSAEGVYHAIIHPALVSEA